MRVDPDVEKGDTDDITNYRGDGGVCGRRERQTKLQKGTEL